MADSFIRVPADSLGKKVDSTSLDVGADTVYRQRIVIGDNSATAQFATVTGGALLVTGGVAVSGTAQVAIGTPFTVNDISRTVQVAVATPFTVNNISATVSVVNGAGTALMGAVSLAAGTANIGFINGVSATVQVAIGTPFTINNISATAVMQLGTVFTTSGGPAVKVGDSANNALRVSIVAGGAGIASQVSLAAGTANIGFLDSISRTVQVAIGTPFTLNNVSATVQVAIGTPFTVNNVSATVNVVMATLPGAYIDHASYSPIESTFVVMGGIMDDVGPDTLTEGMMGPFRITARRGLHVSLKDNNGNGLGTAGGALHVSVQAISATASVVLAAGTANVGTLNDISRTVQVAIGTPFTLNNVSATVQVAIGTPFTVNNVSATVTTQVSGYTPALMSASHGPKCVTASTSANVTLIASPGAGASIHITMLACSNAGAVGSRARIGTSASLVTVAMFMASAGGGFVMQFDPPWKLSASEAALCSVKPNTADGLFNVQYYVAP